MTAGKIRMIPYHAFCPLHLQIEYWVVDFEESTVAEGPLRLRALRRYTAACTQRDSSRTIKQGDFRCACSSQEACASVHCALTVDRRERCIR